MKYWLRSTVFATMVALTPLAASAQQPQRGGTMTVTFKDDVATLDPAIGYDWQNWSMIKSLFSRLMDYKPGTAELSLHLPRASRSHLTACPIPSSCGPTLTSRTAGPSRPPT